MLSMFKKKLGLKVALITNILLLIVMIAGGYFLVRMQCGLMEDQLMNEGKIQSVTGSVISGKILEEAIDNGVFTLKEIFDTDYQEIGDFTPSKYHTKYDSYLDKALLPIIDSYLENKVNIFAIAVDKNGYCPVHNTRFQKPITGDLEKDKTGNRTKRIFSDKVGKRAAENSETGFRQIYRRDTGEKVWDISTPIYVKGRHWGAFRVGISLEKIREARNSMILSMSIVIAVILMLSMAIVFLSVNASLKPLRRLTDKASKLAGGNVNEKISTKFVNEIGDLAIVLEQLRLSLNFAMKKLRKNSDAPPIKN